MRNEMEEQGRPDLEGLYAELEGHLAAERWIEGIAGAYRILALESSYRDVEELLERAKAGLAAAEERREAARAEAAPVAVEAPVGRPRRWLVWLAALGGVGVVVVGLLVGGYIALSALGVIEPGLLIRRAEQETPTAIAQATPEAGPIGEPTNPPAVRIHLSDEGDFAIQYPAEWAVSDSDELPNAVIFAEQREAGAIFMVIFGQSRGQSAEQIWHDVMTIRQLSTQDEVEDWWISEAQSIRVGGEHARMVGFLYTRIENQLQRQGYTIGLVHGEMNYALVGEATHEDWEGKSPLLEAMIESFRFR